MHNPNTQLLCTFSSATAYLTDIQQVQGIYKIDGGKIYILQNKEDDGEIFLTYNVEKDGAKFFQRTISVHRKKDYNILYSINAMNELIKEENGGSFSPNHRLDWSKFRDSIIVVNEGKVKIFQTKLLKVFFI